MGLRRHDPLLKITIRVVREDYDYLRTRYGPGNFQSAIREMLSSLVQKMRERDKDAA